MISKGYSGKNKLSSQALQPPPQQTWYNMLVDGVVKLYVMASTELIVGRSKFSNLIILSIIELQKTHMIFHPHVKQENSKFLFAR